MREPSVRKYAGARISAQEGNHRHASPKAGSPCVAVAEVLSRRPGGATSRPVNSRAADDYLKATSLKSIETISISVIGLRSGPRV